MNKNRIIFPFFVIIAAHYLLTSCSSSPEIKVVEETWAPGQEKIVRFYKEKGDQKVLTKEILYYQNGQKEMEGTFNKAGERHGEWKYWYDNGNMWSEGEFKNGLSHGYRKVYHPNGKLYYEGKYKNDEPVGVWKFYDEEGRFLKEQKY